MTDRPRPRPIIGANWKMNLTPGQADAHLSILRDLLVNLDDRDLFVLPPYPALAIARERLRGTAIAWGAQDVHPDDFGPNTGDVSAPMLADLGCRFVEVGHSERRLRHGETPELVGTKVAAVIRWGMTPILCVGEAEQQGADAALACVLADLDRILAGLGGDGLPNIVVAYEPIWAIGQGMAAAPPDDVAAVHRGIHAWLARRGFGPERVRVIYGGSVDAASARELLRLPDVDGLFIGRAALDPHVFAAIARTPLQGG